MLQLLKTLTGRRSRKEDKGDHPAPSAYTQMPGDNKEYPGEHLPEMVTLLAEAKLSLTSEPQYEPIGDTKPCNGHVPVQPNGDVAKEHGHNGVAKATDEAEPIYSKVDKSSKSVRGSADGSEMTDEPYTDLIKTANDDTDVAEKRSSVTMSTFKAPPISDNSLTDENQVSEEEAVCAENASPPPRLQLDVDGEGELGDDNTTLDDLLAELEHTCTELDLQLSEAQEQKRRTETPPEPVAAVLEPEVIVQGLPQSHSCPDLGNIRLRNGKKTVTFNDNVERFERPASFLEGPDSSEYMRPIFVASGDVDHNETYIKVPAPLQLERPEVKGARKVKDDDNESTNSDDVTMVKKCYFAAIGSPLKSNRSEIVAIKLHGSTKAKKPEMCSEDQITVLEADSQVLPPDDQSVDALSIASDRDIIEKPKPAIRVRRLPKLRTAFIVLALLCTGLFSEVTDLLLHALAYNVDSSYEAVSRSYAARGLGILLGTLLASVHASYCYGNTDIVLAVAMVIGGGCTVVLPWCRGVAVLMAAGSGRGLAQGLLLIGGLVQLQRSWPVEHLSPYIHLVFTLLAVGAAASTQLITPFLTYSSHFVGLIPFLESIGMDNISFFLKNDLDTKFRADKMLNETLNEPLFSVSDHVVADNGYHGYVYSQLDLPAVVIAVVFITCLCVICALSFSVLFVYHHTQKWRKNRRERENREIQRRILKEQIHVIQTLGEHGHCPDSSVSGEEESPHTCLKERTSSDQEPTEAAADTGEEHPLILSPGPCGLEEQIAKLNELAKEHIKCHGSLPQAGRNESDKKVTIKAPEVTFRWFQKRIRFDLPLLLYLYVFFTFPLAMEIIYSRFLYVYAAKCLLHFTLLQGSLLITVFWGAMILGRGLAVPMSRVLTPNAMMITCLTMNLLCPIILLIYGRKYPTILWLFSALIGCHLGPVLPGGLTWGNVFLSRAPKALALAICFAAFGAALFSWLCGVLLDYFGYTALMYLAIATAAVGLLLYLPLMGDMSKGTWYKIQKKPVPTPKHTVQVSYV